MTTNDGDSPAVRVMDEAIELAIEERSPYRKRTGQLIERGLAIRSSLASR